MSACRSRSERAGRAGLIGFSILVFAFLVLPILAVIPLSLNPTTFLVFPEGEFSLRSEEHTSELQSLMRISYAVFCLKKKNNSHMKHLSQATRTKNTQYISLE